MHGSLLPTSHKVIADDIPWMMSLGYERYGPYDPGGALTVLLQAINSPKMLVIRDENKTAWLIASHVTPPWYPNLHECLVMALCTRPGSHWQGMKLLRESVVWARLRGCTLWRFHSDTRHDIGALARRIGAHADSPRYVMEL